MRQLARWLEFFISKCLNNRSQVRMNTCYNPRKRLSLVRKKNYSFEPAMTDENLKNQTAAILYTKILYIHAPLTLEPDNQVNKGNIRPKKGNNIILNLTFYTGCSWAFVQNGKFSKDSSWSHLTQYSSLLQHLHFPLFQKS